MSAWVAVWLAAMWLASVAGAAAGDSRERDARGDRIIAVVNQDAITESDVRSHMSALLEESPQPGTEEEAEQMQRAVLLRLVDERLILQEAKSLGVAVRSEDVARRLQQIKERLGGPAEYAAMLQESGLSEEQLKQKIRHQLLAQQAIDEKVRSRLVVSPSEVAGAATSGMSGAAPGKEVLVQHILIRTTRERSPEHALALAAQLRERLRHGEPFEALAKAHSEDPHAEEGGSLGWVRQGQLMPELDDAAFKLQANEYSEPIKTRLGFHLLKVLERRQLSEQQASESRREIEQRIYQEKFNKAMMAWLNELRQKAYIHVINE